MSNIQQKKQPRKKSFKKQLYKKYKYERTMNVIP